MSDMPNYMVFADGVDVSAGLAKHHASITVTDHAGSESDSLELKISDKDGRIAIPKKGTKLSVFMGYTGGVFMPMGVFSVDDVTSEGGDSGLWINITAKSADMGKAQKEKRTKNYHNKSLKDILSEEAGEHGLDLLISPELSSIKHDFIAKTNQSLLAFGTGLAKKHDAVFKIAGGKMIFAKRQQAKKLTGGDMPTIPVAWGANLLSWSIKPQIIRAEHGKVETRYYDPDQAKDIIQTEGAGEGAVYRLNGHYQDKTEAKQAAQSKKKELERGEGGGSFSIVGNALAMAECEALVFGTRPGVDGSWFVKTAAHSAGADQPYTTQLTVEKKAT